MHIPASIPPLRRPHLLLSLFLAVLILAIHQRHNAQSHIAALFAPNIPPEQMMIGVYDVQQRLNRFKNTCEEDDTFEKEYGRTNLRMSRAYEGTLSPFCLIRY
jgi:hypothetical protein